MQSQPALSWPFHALSCLLQATNEGLVNFDPPRQSISIRPYHCTSEFVQRRPGGLVTAQSPTPAGDQVRSRRSFDSLRTTLLGTTALAVSAYPGKSCQPSRTFAAYRIDIDIIPSAQHSESCLTRRASKPIGPPYFFLNTLDTSHPSRIARQILRIVRGKSSISRIYISWCAESRDIQSPLTTNSPLNLQSPP